jgi:ABC-type nitrate/sulfonate/bicarbonate transport system permease component
MSRRKRPGVGVEIAHEVPVERSGRRKFALLGSTLELRLISALAIAAFMVLWQLSFHYRWVTPLFTSSPYNIILAARTLISNGEMARHGVASLKLFVVGMGVSMILAVPLGVLIGWYRRMNAALDPFVSVLHATPRIAMIPLVLVWFGIGFKSQVIIVVLAAVFPLLINTMAGIRAIDPQLLRVARTYMAGDLAIFRTLALPTALPYIATGFRLALAQGLIGVVVAEYFLGNVGIGALITSAGLTLRTDIVFVGVFLTAGVALLLTALVRRIQDHLDRWKPVE